MKIEKNHNITGFVCFFLLCCFALSLPRAAAALNGNSLVVDLAERHVDITAGFNGARLVVFGERTEPGNVAIVIKGPPAVMVVRHKEEVSGLWMNREAVSFSNVPIYYDYAVSAPANEIAPAEALAKRGIGLDAFGFIHIGKESPATVKSFREALIRNKQAQGHFPLMPEPIEFLSDHLFRTGFDLPADIPTGNYEIASYLFKDGALIDQQKTTLRVAQKGFSASLNYYAYQKPWLYGLASVIFPMLAGFAAFMAFKRK